MGPALSGTIRNLSYQKRFRMSKLYVLLTAAAVSFGLATASAKAADIVGVAAGDPHLKTLVAAVKAADLVDTLKSDGPFTVFAPTDAAFAKLPKGVLKSLLKPENKKKLASILTYHVVPSKILSSSIVGKRTAVTTVQGEKLSVNARHGVTVNGARVVKADIKASNGVIHVINKVLLPKG